MAEFQEVMRQYGRMCTAHAGCIDCPLHKPDGVSDRCNIGAFVNDSEYIEREIMKWAAEHPEPVYMTWGEWFLRTRQVPMINGCDNDWLGLISSHIPAEFAEKLGIKPKKVTNDG